MTDISRRRVFALGAAAAVAPVVVPLIPTSAPLSLLDAVTALPPGPLTVQPTRMLVTPTLSYERFREIVMPGLRQAWDEAVAELDDSGLKP